MRHTMWALAGMGMLVAGGTTTAQDAPAGLSWVPVLADALVKAKAQTQPVMVAVVTGDEKDRTEFLATHKESGVAALASKVVAVVACDGLHASSAADPCPMFAGVTCGQHQSAFDDVAKKYCQGERRVPQHVFLNPAGKCLFKRGFAFVGGDQQELARRMNVAVAMVAKDAVDRDLAEKEKFRFDVLVARIRENDPDGRKSAASSLGNTDAKDALMSVMQAIRTTSDDEARMGIYAALGVRGNWSALELLLGMGLADKDSFVRLDVIEAIEKIDMPDAADQLVAHIGKDGALMPAAMSLKGACFLDPFAKKTVAAALSGAGHNRVTMRIGAAWGMSRILGNDKILATARAMVGKDHEGNGRAAFAWAVGVLGEQSDVAVIQAQLTKEPTDPQLPREVMAAAIERLNGQVRGDYDQLIQRLLETEAVEDFSDGNKGKGKWGKWGGKGGSGGTTGGPGGGWGGKGGGGKGKG